MSAEAYYPLCRCVKRALRASVPDRQRSAARYNLADVAVGCALGYLELRMPDLNWRKLYPNLGKLFDKLSKRASFKDTAPPKS